MIAQLGKLIARQLLNINAIQKVITYRWFIQTTQYVQ